MCQSTFLHEFCNGVDENFQHQFVINIGHYITKACITTAISFMTKWCLIFFMNIIPKPHVKRLIEYGMSIKVDGTRQFTLSRWIKFVVRIPVLSSLCQSVNVTCLLKTRVFAVMQFKFCRNWSFNLSNQFAGAKRAEYSCKQLLTTISITIGGRKSLLFD